MTKKTDELRRVLNEYGAETIGNDLEEMADCCLDLIFFLEEKAEFLREEMQYFVYMREKNEGMPFKPPKEDKAVRRKLSLVWSTE